MKAFLHQGHCSCIVFLPGLAGNAGTVIHIISFPPVPVASGIYFFQTELLYRTAQACESPFDQHTELNILQPSAQDV
jgi:hypothetical protein